MDVRNGTHSQTGEEVQADDRFEPLLAGGGERAGEELYRRTSRLSVYLGHHLHSDE